METTRLAPSPTGALHLGNARTFALTWLWARSRGAGLVFRMEDLETPRTKAWAAAQVLEDLRWLGVEHDGPVVVQSTREAFHRAALQDLLAQRLVYACSCSRRDVEGAQAAPHAEDELRYPGTCRGRYREPAHAFDATRRPVAIRLLTPPGVVPFHDEVRGQVMLDPALHGGDFVIARWEPEHGFAVGYQLAVVVDDAAMGVTTVIRGDDLVPSTPRQILLQRALGLSTPAYAHLPLVVGPDGRRLAKRHGDTRLAAYREAGVPAAAVREWIARVSGLDGAALDAPAASGFTWARLPRDRVIVPRHAVADGPPRPPPP